MKTKLELQKELSILKDKYQKSTTRYAYVLGNKIRAIEVLIALSNEFSKILANDLTPDQLSEVIAKNKTFDYVGVCASHDYIDANETMSEAFINIVGSDIDLQNNSHIELWSNAWNLAKSNDFKTL